MKDAFLSRSKIVFYQFNIDQVKTGKRTFYHNIHLTETTRNENLISNN